MPIPMDERDSTIWALREEGASIKYLSERFSVSYNRIPQILKKVRRQKEIDKLALEYPKNEAFPMAALSMSVRAYNALANAGIRTAGEFLRFDVTNARNTKNVGKRTFDELNDIKRIVKKFLGIELEKQYCPHCGRELEN